MRTLTLGVLIVSGGTLAALPFRKYQAIPDASSAPAQVTGPTQSALDQSNNSVLVTNDSLAKEPPKQTSEERFVALDTAALDAAVLDASVVASNLPPWQPNAPSPTPRSSDIPLSYEDLALPIDQPPPIVKRFNATVPIREQQLERERVSELVMPAMEQLAVTQQLELERVAESVRSFTSEQSSGKAKGSLASSRESSIEPLPSESPNDRNRHWIRQPD